MNEEFDLLHIAEDNTYYPFVQGFENYRKRLIQIFPDESQAINSYCGKIEEICKKFPLYNIEQSTYNFDLSLLSENAKDYIDSLTEDKRLRAALVGNNFIYEGVSDKTPLYVHALVANSYIQSSYKLIGGGDQIAKLLARKIKSLGGDVLRKKQVVQFNIENNNIVSVATDDNQIFKGDTFISNIHPKQTMELVGKENVKSIYYNRLVNLDNTSSVFVLYGVLHQNKVPYTNQNIYSFDDYNVWEGSQYTQENWPQGIAIYLSPDKKNPEYAQSITIMTYMKYSEMEPWIDSFNTTVNKQSRGTSYEEFKEAKAKLLLDKVYKSFPQYKDCLKAYTTSTPLTYRDYIGNDDGSLYGISRNNSDLYRTYLPPNTKIENLYLTGQNINLHGVLGVTVGAILTCSVILKNDSLIHKIRIHNGMLK
jgi:all-trans-retinol 13,14-reductase